MSENLNDVIARIEKLEAAVFGSGEAKIKQAKLPAEADKNKIDFSLNERAYVKRYVADKSGPKRFALLVAFIAKGKVDENITLGEIKKHWERMSAKDMLGNFNMFYASAAKTQGFVNSKEKGSYCLTNEWSSIL